MSGMIYVLHTGLLLALFSWPSAATSVGVQQQDNVDCTARLIKCCDCGVVLVMSFESLI